MGDIETMTDEEALHQLLRKTTNDFTERRKILNRLKQIRQEAEEAYNAKRNKAAEEAASLRQKHADADKARRLGQYDKFQEMHTEQMAKGDAEEALLKQKLAAAEAEKERKLKEASELSGTMAASYGVQSADIVGKK